MCGIFGIFGHDDAARITVYGLYGLQQYGRSAPLDLEDLGPFYRLAEEIQGDVLALQERLAPPPMTEPAA